MSELTREQLLAEGARLERARSHDPDLFSFAWLRFCGTHMGTLLAMVQELEAERDEVRREIVDLVVYAVSTTADAAIVGATYDPFVEIRKAVATLKADRDRLTAEVERLKVDNDFKDRELRRVDVQLRQVTEQAEAEVARLKEAALDHDCPSFGVCPNHTDKLGVDLESCLYCEVMRANAVAQLACQNADKAEAEVTRLRAAALALVEKLEACQSAIDGAFLMAQVHGSKYTGPTYGVELTTLKAELEAQR